MRADAIAAQMSAARTAELEVSAQLGVIEATSRMAAGASCREGWWVVVVVEGTSW
jgi:hypothetical protein